MKKRIAAGIVAALGIVFTPLVSAAEDGGHFKGKPAETLTQAAANFSEYNHKLQAILDGEVSDSDLAEVHILTYTLENALKKINADMDALADTLEAVHKASEKLDRAAVIERGREYLSVSRQIVK